MADSQAAALLVGETSVRAASKEMAASRKACLVVDEQGELVGLVTFKDVLGRVVAKGLSPEETTLAAVMTPRPASVTPDMSLLDALYTMRDGHFLNLPVVDSNTGKALGLLSAMEIVQSLSKLTGKDDGGRSFWASTMGGEDEDGWESQSDAGSMRSIGSTRKGAVRQQQQQAQTKSRPVSKLRPDKPLVLAATTSVAAIARVMVERRAAAVLLTGKDGALSGILTDTDVTRRVVAKELSSEGTVGADVMVRGARHMRRVYPGGTTFAVQRAAPCPDGAVLVHWTFEGRRKGGAVDEGAGCSVFEFEEEDSDAPTPRIAATTVFRTALRAEVDLAAKTAAGEVPQGALLRGGGDSG